MLLRSYYCIVSGSSKLSESSRDYSGCLGVPKACAHVPASSSLSLLVHCLRSRGYLNASKRKLRMCALGVVALAGAAGGLTLAMKKSSVVEDDVPDDGIRAGAVMPLPMSARVMAGSPCTPQCSRTKLRMLLPHHQIRVLDLKGRMQCSGSDGYRFGVLAIASKSMQEG